MRGLSQVTNLVLMCFSVLVGGMSIKLGIGDPSNMGPGFAPLVACILLFCFVFFVLVFESKTTTERKERVMEARSLIKPIGLCLVILGYMFLLTIFGYPLTAFLAVFGISSLTAPKRWVANALFAGLLAVASYLFFSWLGQGLPSGVLGIG